MEVNVEDLMLSQFSIKAKTVGDAAENYAVGDVRVSPNILKVTGPESVVNQIDHVEATIDVTGASADLTDSVVPVVYNANGEAVDTSKLNFNIDKVTISATILNIRNLSVEIEPSGTVADSDKGNTGSTERSRKYCDSVRPAGYQRCNWQCSEDN